eukprot:g22303.t2
MTCGHVLVFPPPPGGKPASNLIRLGFAGERSRAEIPQRLETPGDGNVPKYLRLSCILRPVAAQVPMPPHSQRRKRRPRQQPRATPMSWSELRDALGLTVAAGLGPLLLKCASGEHRLPTGVWIVLDPMVAERLRRDTVTEEELAEAADLPLGSRPCAGKAWVAQQSVSSLQLLDEDELTWSAAEANFAKCARGSCFVALKHAAFVLKALATKKCMQAQEEGVEPEKPLETTLEEIDSKVNRAAGLVGSRAAAESRRKKSPERQKKAQEPAPESGAPTSPRPAAATVLRRGFQAQRDFVNFVSRKFGNCVRLWFLLDPEDRWPRPLSHWRHVWNESTRAAQLLRHISLHDIDPATALALADFKVVLMKQFNGSVEGFMKTADSKRGQRAGREEFVKIVEEHLQGQGKKLFDLLCRTSTNTVSAGELRFLEKWRPPRYFVVPPDRTRMGQFKSGLADAHGNALKAWFRILDTDQAMRITAARFHAQMLRYRKLTDEEAAQVWRALDVDCSGHLFLRRYHPKSHEAAASLKRWAAKHGGVAKFISRLEPPSGKVTKVSFRKALVDVLEAPAADLLFDGLDVGDTGHLTEQEVRSSGITALMRAAYGAKADALKSSSENLTPETEVTECPTDPVRHAASQDSVLEIEMHQNPETAKERRASEKLPAKRIRSVVRPASTSARWQVRCAFFRHHLGEILNSQRFDTMLGVIIIANAVNIGLELSWRAQGQDTTICNVLEHCFLAIYTIDLGIVSQWILDPFFSDVAEVHTLLMLRCARLLRLAKTVRFLMRFKELWMLVQGLANSAYTMVYTILLLFVVLYIFACLALQLLYQHPMIEQDEIFAKTVQENFSDLASAMVTLLQFVSFDNIDTWSDVHVYKPLGDRDPLLLAYFVVVILVVGITIMNLVTAVIVNSSLEQVAKDKSLLQTIEEQNRKKVLADLRAMFYRMDYDGSGEVLRELTGFDDPLELFDALDTDEKGEIGIEEFCDGLWEVAVSDSPLEIKRMQTFFLTMILAMRKSRRLALLASQSALWIMMLVSTSIGVLLRRLTLTINGDAAFIRITAAALMILFGLQSFRELSAGGNRATQAKKKSKLLDIFRFGVLIFLAEWGDRSMLATITLATTKSAFGVLVGGCCGHLVAGTLAVVAGHFLEEHVSDRVVKLTGGVLFVLFGISTLLNVW